MLSPGDVAIIRAEIDRLEKARRECIDMIGYSKNGSKSGSISRKGN